MLAHNTIRWFARLGGLHPDGQTLTVAATIPTRFLTLPGRLVNHSDTPSLPASTSQPHETRWTNQTPWLRDAQHAAIANLEHTLEDNKPRALIQMATGPGKKTFAAANIAERLSPRPAPSASCLW